MAKKNCIIKQTEGLALCESTALLSQTLENTHCDVNNV